MRSALGAGRGRILGFYLSESLVLGALGGGLGLLLAIVVLETLVRLAPASLPRLHEVGTSGPVLAFAAAVSLLAALAFGAMPLLRGSAAALGAQLGDGARGSTLGRERQRVRSLLIVAQVALALVLAVAAGLMVRSFWHLKDVEPGFRAGGVLTFGLSLPRRDYPDAAAAARFQQQVSDRLAELPGVEVAAAVSCLPLGGCFSVNPLYEEGVAWEAGETPPAVEIHAVSAGYFRALGIPLVSGRAIERADLDQLTGAAVVSKTLAERFWPGKSPIGKRVYPDLPSGDLWYTIVGVVGDVLSESLTAGPAATIYLPLLDTNGGGGWPYSLSFVLSAGTGPLLLVEPVRRTMQQLDPGLAVAEPQLLEELVAAAEAPWGSRCCCWWSPGASPSPSAPSVCTASFPTSSASARVSSACGLLSVRDRATSVP